MRKTMKHARWRMRGTEASLRGPLAMTLASWMLLALYVCVYELTQWLGG